MSTKTRWERFCDWLSGPEAPEMKSAYPVPPEPIRPFVAKLVECIRLGDCKWEPYFYSYSFGINIRFALAEDLSASIDVRTFEAFGGDVTPRLGAVRVGGMDMEIAPGEVTALMDAYQRALDERVKREREVAEVAQAKAIAKIEAYTPKAP